MKSYELVYLISSDLSEEELKTFQEKMTSLIQEEGGTLNKTENPIKKRLAYPINKKGQSYLAVLNFHLNPEKLRELEKKLKSESQILRYLISVKPPAKNLVPTRKLPSIKPVEEMVKPKTKEKVELKEIEKKLEEILREQ